MRFSRILYLFKSLVWRWLDGEGRRNARKQPDGCSYCPRRNSRVGFPSAPFFPTPSFYRFLSLSYPLFIFLQYPRSSLFSFLVLVCSCKNREGGLLDKQLSKRAHLVSSGIVLGRNLYFSSVVRTNRSVFQSLFFCCSFSACKEYNINWAEQVAKISCKFDSVLCQQVLPSKRRKKEPNVLFLSLFSSFSLPYKALINEGLSCKQSALHSSIEFHRYIKLLCICSHFA